MPCSVSLAGRELGVWSVPVADASAWLLRNSVAPGEELVFKMGAVEVERGKRLAADPRGGKRSSWPPCSLFARESLKSTLTAQYFLLHTRGQPSRRIRRFQAKFYIDGRAPRMRRSAAIVTVRARISSWKCRAPDRRSG